MSIRIALDEPELCGMGQGSECCAYMAGDLEGFFCGREFIDLKYAIDCRVEMGTMGAKRIPLREFPYCQLAPASVSEVVL